MSEVTQSVDVVVDVHTAYTQWTQFEEFAKFMEGVRAVEPLDDRYVRWDVDIAGMTASSRPSLRTEPGSKNAWRSRTGVDQRGVVTFHPLDDHTRVTLQMALEPERVA